MLQLAASAVALARLARGRDRPPPLRAAPAPPSLTVLVPARDEARRIGPCLEGLRGLDVLVVDDGSADATAAVARAGGARVLAAAPKPDGWVGKSWALQQGLEAADADVIVCLDADTRPRPALAGALAAALAEHDLVSGSPRYDCATAGERWLHPSFLASLVYRYGPPGPAAAPARAIANGQCLAFERERLLAAGGFAPVAHHMTDDVALARHLARRGWRVAMRDVADLLEVDMHDSAGELWREWGRSIAAADVTPRAQLAGEAALVWLVLALPVLRLAAGRPRRLDLVLLAARFGLLGALRRAYPRRGAAFWLSPLADPLTAVRITWSALRPPRRWRGRVYGAGGTAPR
jgi:dolichol-phosphate mannosyltransferase